MIDTTFHHPDKYTQLLIILFKDIIISQMVPCFYILMRHKNEILYDIIFKTIIRILTQQNIYNDTDKIHNNRLRASFNECYIL